LPVVQTPEAQSPAAPQSAPAPQLGEHAGALQVVLHTCDPQSLAALHV
jgi:hypothetical protein